MSISLSGLVGSLGEVLVACAPPTSRRRCEGMPVIRDRSLDFRVQFSGPGSDLPNGNPPQSALNQLKGTLEASSQDSCSF